MAKKTEQLPPLPALATLSRRLAMIFPEGTTNRANAAGERASKTAFVMLYVGAVERAGCWIRPDQVTRMSDAQAEQTSLKARKDWASSSLRKTEAAAVGRWYSVNSREGIRDDTLRYAWQPLGAVVEREGLATTSSSPRWALAADFASILTWGVGMQGEPTNLADLEQTDEFRSLITAWQSSHLSPEARARVQLMRRVGVAGDSVSVTMPDGNTRRLAHGDSARIMKALVEQFAQRFLVQPAILWLSDSREHVDIRDEALARSIGLNISESSILPDAILVDLNPRRLLLVFCEVVATDGPMNERRKADIMRLIEPARFEPANVAFMTAFLDRDSPSYRKLAGSLAWGSLSWTASEPDKLTLHVDGARSKLKLEDALDLLNSNVDRRR